MGKKRVIAKSQEELLKDAQTGSTDTVRSSGASKKLRDAKVYIISSYNNTLVSLTDMQGNVLVNLSAGAIGFKGTKKSTPFAASKVIDTIAAVAKGKGVERIAVLVKGVGSGRDSALRSLGAKGFDIISIQDVTPVPHNGPRARKVRKV